MLRIWLHHRGDETWWWLDEFGWFLWEKLQEHPIEIMGTSGSFPVIFPLSQPIDWMNLDEFGWLDGWMVA